VVRDQPGASLSGVARGLPRPILEAPGGPEGPRRRIVLISYHFPPDQTIGARRWARLAPFAVERGWGLDVITCAPSADADMRQLAALPPGVRVFGVPLVELRVQRVERVVWQVYRSLRDRLRRGPDAGSSADTRPSGGSSARAEWIDRSTIRWRLATPRGLLRAYWAWLQHARYGAWADAAASLTRAIVEPGVHLVVVTSGPPHRTHDAGRQASVRTGLPFVMDMRDPWSLSERVHESVATPLWFRLARRYEAIAIQQASLVVANTEAACDALVAAYPSAGAKMITVMNGSDDDPLPLARRAGRFTIAYTGTIYLERHPRSLFRAAADVIGKLGVQPTEFGIEFLGGDIAGQDGVIGMAREEGIAGFVSKTPPRSHAEALEFQAGATMHVTFPGWDSVAIPAKIFECIRFDAWLLALADPGSATDRLLRGSGADVVSPDDRAAMAAAIRRRYEQYRSGVRPGRVVVDDRFSRRTQAKILLDAFARVSGLPGS
jgi:hypothetical protein